MAVPLRYVGAKTTSCFQFVTLTGDVSTYCAWFLSSVVYCYTY